jgi:hypothetical protein
MAFVREHQPREQTDQLGAVAFIRVQFAWQFYLPEIAIIVPPSGTNPP